jgi:hypothetical protein
MPNPDFEKTLPFTQTINREEAERIFDDCFRGEDDEYAFQREINKTIEKQAFLEAFDTLTEVDQSSINIFQSKSVVELKDIERKWEYGGSNVRQADGWACLTSQPSDFLSLMRNVIVTNLVYHVGLKVRLLFSHAGDYIYLVVASNEENVMNEAERTGYKL